MSRLREDRHNVIVPIPIRCGGGLGIIAPETSVLAGTQFGNNDLETMPVGLDGTFSDHYIWDCLFRASAWSLSLAVPAIIRRMMR